MIHMSRGHKCKRRSPRRQWLLTNLGLINYSRKARSYIYNYKPTLYISFNDIMNIRLVIFMLTQAIAYMCVYLGVCKDC